MLTGWPVLRRTPCHFNLYPAQSSGRSLKPSKSTITMINAAPSGLRRSGWLVDSRRGIGPSLLSTFQLRESHPQVAHDGHDIHFIPGFRYVPTSWCQAVGLLCFSSRASEQALRCSFRHLQTPRWCDQYRFVQSRGSYLILRQLCRETGYCGSTSGCQCRRARIDHAAPRRGGRTRPARFALAVCASVGCFFLFGHTVRHSIDGITSVHVGHRLTSRTIVRGTVHELPTCDKCLFTCIQAPIAGFTCSTIDIQ